MNKIAIVGATGATGLELIKLALDHGYDPSMLLLIASSKSVGRSLAIHNQTFTIQEQETLFTVKPQVVFLAAGGKVSISLKDKLLAQGSFVIDLSSAFRQDPSVPLIVPEINPEAFDVAKHNFVSSPNCVTTLYLLVLAPILKQHKAKRILLSTYQAASGAGQQAMEELKKETLLFLEGKQPDKTFFQDPYAFNLFAHNAPFAESEDNDEEVKIRNESRKILDDDKLKISATCIRVPTLRAHAISAYVDFEETLEKSDLYKLLENASGIKKLEDFETNRFPTPQIATCQNEVYYGRIRKDITSDNGFWFWIVGDQLLKGASLNAWQIFQLKESHETVYYHARTTSASF